MEPLDRASILKASIQFKNPPGYSPSYGTAGFRANASLLEATVFRSGLLAACRSMITGQACGIMITASHNPIQDNGVKLIEPNGGMLPQSCEAEAELLAKCDDDDQEAVIDIIDKMTQDARIKGRKGDRKVLVGYDTRPSAPFLLSAATAGIAAVLGGEGVVDYGLVTTPQLHYAVFSHNLGIDSSLAGYFRTLVNAYEGLVKDLPHPPTRILRIDCANGVGAIQLLSLSRLLDQSQVGLKLILHNAADTEEKKAALNDRCGSDFVQKEKSLPSDFETLETGDQPDSRCCSIDGDAD